MPDLFSDSEAACRHTTGVFRTCLFMDEGKGPVSLRKPLTENICEEAWGADAHPSGVIAAAPFRPAPGMVSRNGE